MEDVQAYYHGNLGEVEDEYYALTECTVYSSITDCLGFQCSSLEEVWVTPTIQGNL